VTDDTTRERGQAADADTGGFGSGGTIPERRLPAEAGVLAADPGRGGGAATPSFETSPDERGLPGAPAPTRIGRRVFAWGERTYVMGVLNVTPDSFSGDGLLAGRGPSAPGQAPGIDAPGIDATVAAALALADEMIDGGADLLDIGGESTRPGHELVSPEAERARVVPVVAAIHERHPDLPLSVDTTKPSVAAAALDAGASLLNDIWGVADDDGLARLAAERGVPIVLMHNRARASYTNLLAEVIGELQRAIERTLAAGVPWDAIIVDPGFGFGKAPVQNLALLAGLGGLRVLGRPILLGTSRKSTLGKVLDLPPEERLEATLATTALAVAAGVDIVRVHDVRANVRAARMSDAVVRGAVLRGAVPS
jgi:dihydropteroate synthase